MNGGFWRALFQSFTARESFFRQQIRPLMARAALSTSTQPYGAIQVIDIGTHHYLLNDGAFMAATASGRLTSTHPKLEQTAYWANRAAYL